MSLKYDREAVLRDKLNSFLVSSFEMPDRDYYSSLNSRDLLGLKSALNDINNILTLRVTTSFAKEICSALKTSDLTTQKVIQEVRSTKPNTNGYDILINEPPVIAEVKCNVPINKGRKYGSAQRSGIIKDVGALLKGKSKSNVQVDSYLKFMVFLDLPEIRDATHSLLDAHDSVVFVDDLSNANSTGVVYVAFIAA